MKTLLYILCVGLTLSISCNSSQKKAHNGISLMKYGFPINVNIDENAEVLTGSKGYSSDIAVKSGKDFNIHIFMSQALHNNIQQIKQSLKAEVISNPYFIKMVEEYDDGFIFEKESVNFTGKCYDFRWILLQGDKEFIGQAAITGEFTEQDVKRMYNSLK
ncbi:MAG: hypothetical protein IPM42_16315 [Saprospiraceae bacterium]|nr:hypothetical protein [Saprospiraceae bacterium]